MTSPNLLTEQAVASLAYKIVAAEHVRKLESKAAEMSGLSLFELMKKAGKAAFEVFNKHWPMAECILVIVGNGNNAGDGYIFAALAKQQGKRVSLVCENPSRVLRGDAGVAQNKWRQAGGEIRHFDEVTFSDFDVIIDALLGTGTLGKIKEDFQQVINQINLTDKPVLSIDIPSGMHADTGISLPICVKASVTVSYVAVKPGLVTGIGKEFCGELEFSDLDIGDRFFALADVKGQCVEWSMLKPLPVRPKHANKGMFGKLLCIGGNQGMSGAVRLSAEAALRAGAGLVKVFCHESSAMSVMFGRPEIMVSHKDLKLALEWCSCVVIGPGLGQDDWAQQQISRLFSYLADYPKPLVLDADALNILSDPAFEIAELKSLPETVVTPHPGEGARLLSADVRYVEEDRYRSCKNITSKFNCMTVLKGAGTVMNSPVAKKEPPNDSLFWVCRGGNPGMATAGMGDLLTGIIGAFMAQGMSPHEATIYGVCAHSEAGDRVAMRYGQRGMIASDLLQPLRNIVNAL